MIAGDGLAEWRCQAVGAALELIKLCQAPHSSCVPAQLCACVRPQLLSPPPQDSKPPLFFSFLFFSFSLFPSVFLTLFISLFVLCTIHKYISQSSLV